MALVDSIFRLTGITFVISRLAPLVFKYDQVERRVTRAHDVVVRAEWPLYSFKYFSKDVHKCFPHESAGSSEAMKVTASWNLGEIVQDPFCPWEPAGKAT